jgi:maleate cis-trans isomerase
MTGGILSMTQTSLKIGFLGSSAPSSPHHDTFRAFIPKDIDFSFVQEAGEKTSLYDARGKVDALIGQARQLIHQDGWDGVIISGAPKEALNPGMWEQVSAALPVPVSLALRSSVAALKAFNARRILLMTPVDDQLKKMYRDYIGSFGIESFFPPQTLRAHTDALKLAPADVQAMTRAALAQFPEVDAIYFQGALLDPLPILEKMEAEFDVPIVASNPAMLWLILSKLGRSYHISGYGKLLASWPKLTAGPF